MCRLTAPGIPLSMAVHSIIIEVKVNTKRIDLLKQTGVTGEPRSLTQITGADFNDGVYFL